MLVSFETLEGNSRIWVYQASRKLDETAEKQLDETISVFCEQWVAHGEPLRASYKLFYHQFLVLSVDQKVFDASGCSIDGSVRTIKAIGTALEIDFFDRTKVAFFIGDDVKLIRLADLKDAFATGILNSDTLTFNPQVATKYDLEKSWIVPAGKTWLAKYLSQSALA